MLSNFTIKTVEHITVKLNNITFYIHRHITQLSSPGNIYIYN